MASFVNSAKNGLRDLILSIAPPWLRSGIRPGPLNGGMGDAKYIYQFGLLGDALLEKLDQAVRARMPGQGTVTALPILGDDRVLIQGPGEPDASFILRLKSFLQDWSYAGSHWALLEQTRFYMTPFLPLVRMVSNTGVWDWFESQAPNANADGSWIPPIHWPHPGGNFNWDGDTTAWWRVWQIIFPGLSIVGNVTGATNASPIAVTVTAHGLATGDQVALSRVHGNIAANGYWTVTVTDANTFSLNGSTGSGAWATSSPQGVCYLIPSTALQTTGTTSPQVIGPAPFVYGSAGAKWGVTENISPTSPGGVSWGLNVPSSWFLPLRILASEWKAANEWLRYFVVSFDPSGSFSPWSGSTPNGSWEYWGDRNVNARYAGGQI